MLSYRHGFHAGNWADVQKHTALALLLLHLRRKDKPFCVLDAYAGDGGYGMTSPEALKTGEFKEGIGRIWGRMDAPQGVDWYLEQVRAANPDGMLLHYPGSPALSRAALRDGDRLVLGELHPAAWQALKERFGRDRQVALHRRDGLEFLTALLPPTIRRGLVLLDPAYEVKDEYERLAAALCRGFEKWREGIYAVWYPVLAAGRHEGMIREIAGLAAPRGILKAEIAPPEPPPAGMRAAGMVVLNPPWGFAEAMETAGGWLARALWVGAAGHHDLVWLAPPAEE